MNNNVFINAFAKMGNDKRLQPSHVSLYMALLCFWNENNFQNPTNITRKNVMSICKIKSKVTYHKCIKDLNDFGYIKYEPSYNPFTGSSVTINTVYEENKKIENKVVIEKRTEKELLLRISLS